MRNYDGVHACQDERRSIESSGYVQAFTTLYSDGCCPTEVRKASNGSGWDIRKSINAWAREKGIEDYVIFRATDYLSDLHGRRVYEVYTRNGEPS